MPARKRTWSSETVRRLRELADAGWTVATIAALLERSESAIRNKAAMHGISLRPATERPLSGR